MSFQAAPEFAEIVRRVLHRNPLASPLVRTLEQDSTERIRDRCVITDTIEGRTVAGRIPPWRLSLATSPINPVGVEMPEDCTCGSPVSPDDTNCPHCGRPLSPEQAEREAAEAREIAAKLRELEEAEKHFARGPWAPNCSALGVLVNTTLIPACAAVIVQNHVAAATIPATLLTLCVSLWAGFAAVTLYHWKFPKFLYPDMARFLGVITGLLVVIISWVLDAFSAVADWPLRSLLHATAYVQTLPIAARLPPWVTPDQSVLLALSICALSFGFFHAIAATLGSIIASAIVPGRAKR